VTKPLELSLITDRKVDVRRVMVVGTTELVGVFNGCVSRLDRLLREWDVAASYCVEIRFGNLRLHVNLS
jgi:hypothetical protein